MKRRQGSFGFLWGEMIATLFGRKTVEWPDNGGPEYLRYVDGDLAGSLESGEGSDNLIAMAKSVEFHRHGEALPEWLDWFDGSMGAWMGNEVDSTTYDTGHVCAVLLVADRALKTGDTILYELALRWLEYFSARAMAKWSPRAGRVLAVGQRSAGHNGKRFFADDWLMVAGGWDPPAEWKDGGHDKPFLWALRDIIREAHKLFAVGRNPIDYLLNCGRTTKTRLCILETEFGKAVWHDPANINRATQPVPAAVEIRGKVSWLPDDRADGSERIRNPGDCTVLRTATSLVYVSEVFGRQELALPGGRVLIDVVVGLPLASPPIVVPGPTSPVPVPQPPVPGPVGSSPLVYLGPAGPGESLYGSQSSRTIIREIHPDAPWVQRWIVEEKP